MNAQAIRAETPWLEALRAACRTASQSKVAAHLGVSTTVINQVVNEKYPGDLERIRKLVEGAYMGITCDCPVLGDIPTNICLEHQARPFAATNSHRVRLYRACRACPNRREQE